MDRLDLIETFASVVHHKSFSAASRVLGQPLTTVSRKVARLEEELGVQLLVRTTRDVEVTEAGIRYLSETLPLVGAIKDAGRGVLEGHSDPSGVLTVASPVPFGNLYLTPVVIDFMSAYPNVNVRHRLNDERVNYITAGIDVGLRIGLLRQSELKRVNLGCVRLITCASAKYLEIHQPPNSPDELGSHRTVAFLPFGERTRWNFSDSSGGERWVEIAPTYSVDSVDAMVQFVRAGCGIGHFYSYQVAPLIASGELVILLQSFELEKRPVSFLYPSSGYLPQRTRAFLDFAAPPLRTTLESLLRMVG